MFYGSIEGDKLVKPNNYPLSIEKYLEGEKNILNQYINNYDVIVEVGCMVARNMQYIISQGKKYIGIDVVPQYIEEANEIVKNKVTIQSPRKFHKVENETKTQKKKLLCQFTTNEKCAIIKKKRW